MVIQVRMIIDDLLYDTDVLGYCLADSANCCSGSHNTAATCPFSNVQFYGFFSTSTCHHPRPFHRAQRTPTEGNCPNAYAYAYDESSGTALWTCDSSLNADYTLTFCPCVLMMYPHGCHDSYD